jgi:hypothetical protein
MKFHQKGDPLTTASRHVHIGLDLKFRCVLKVKQQSTNSSELSGTDTA